MPCARIETHRDLQYALSPLWDGKNRSIMRSKYCVYASVLNFSPWKWVAASCQWRCVCVKIVWVCVCVCADAEEQYIFCLKAVSSARAPFIKVWQINSCFLSIRLLLFLWRLWSCTWRSDILCHFRLSETEQQSFRAGAAAGTLSADSCLSPAAILPPHCTRRLLLPVRGDTGR